MPPQWAGLALEHMRTEHSRLDDLILLAERGLGLHRVYSLENVCTGTFLVAGDRDQILLDRLQSWNPRTSIADASMLVRKLGIDLLAILASEATAISKVDATFVVNRIPEEVTGWEATDSSGRFNAACLVEGNTEAAMCEAVCSCALKILRAGGAR